MPWKKPTHPQRAWVNAGDADAWVHSVDELNATGGVSHQE